LVINFWLSSEAFPKIFALLFGKNRLGARKNKKKTVVLSVLVAIGTDRESSLQN
jgi:hypothetical protein